MHEDQKAGTEDEAAHELAAQEGELLPPRELMSIVDLGDGSAGPIHTLPVEPREEI